MTVHLVTYLPSPGYPCGSTSCISCTQRSGRYHKSAVECLWPDLVGADHFESLEERMGLLFGVALSAVIPLSTAGRSDRDLGVEDMLAAGTRQLRRS